MSIAVVPTPTAANAHLLGCKRIEEIIEDIENDVIFGPKYEKILCRRSFWC
jgi:hypothetical protein